VFPESYTLCLGRLNPENTKKKNTWQVFADRRRAYFHNLPEFEVPLWGWRLSGRYPKFRKGPKAADLSPAWRIGSLVFVSEKNWSTGIFQGYKVQQHKIYGQGATQIYKGKNCLVLYAYILQGGGFEVSDQFFKICFSFGTCFDGHSEPDPTSQPRRMNDKCSENSFLLSSSSVSNHGS
jgi:hypothetical protein